MKKILLNFILLFAFLSVCGCEKNKTGIPQNSETTVSEIAEISDNEAADAHFSDRELEALRINSDSSNFHNSVNLKSPVPGKVCYVEETDTLFFSDSEGLYQKNGDTVIKLLDTPVYSLNVANGFLYYIVPDGNDVFYYGKAYRLDLSDGEINFLLDNAAALSVYPNGLLYKICSATKFDDGSTSVGTAYMSCDPDGNNSVKRFDFCFAADGNFSAAYNGNAINLVDLESGSAEALTDEDNMVSGISIHENSVYYIRTGNRSLMTSVIGVDVQSGEKTVYSGSDMYFDDYGFCGDVLYLYECGGTFFRAEDMKKFHTQSTYEAVYSCGSKMYGLRPDGKLCELIFEDKNDCGEVYENELGR